MLTLAHRLGPAETIHDGTTVSARIELPTAPQQTATVSSDGYGLLRAAARGELIGLPAILRGWLDLPAKVIATLLVPAMHLISRLFEESVVTAAYRGQG
jgi:hypothetical protein